MVWLQNNQAKGARGSVFDLFLPHSYELLNLKSFDTNALDPAGGYKHTSYKSPG